MTKNLFAALLATLIIAIPIKADAAGRIQNEDVKSSSDITAAAGTATGNLSSTSPCVTSLSFSAGSLAGLSTGLFVYDTTTSANIGSGVTIAGLPGTCSAGQIQLSSNPTANATGDTLTFGGQTSQLINDTKIWMTSTTPPSQLSAAVTSGLIGSGGAGNSGKNYLSDASFEGYPSSGVWTVTTATGTANTSNYTDGSQSLQLAFSSSTGSVSQDASFTTTLSGVNLQASCFVNTSLTGIQLCARVGGVETNCQAVPSTGTWQPVTATMIGPSSGTIGLDVKATSSVTGNVLVDACYVGKAVNSAQLSQSQMFGTASWPNGKASSVSNTATFVNFPTFSATTPTATGNITASTTSFAVTAASVPPGTYQFIINGNMRFGGGQTDGALCSYRITDGTNNTAPVFIQMDGANNSPVSTTFSGFITYTTPQTNLTWQVQAAQGTANGSQNFCSLDGATAQGQVSFQIALLPTTQQAGFRPDATPASLTAYFPNSCSAWSKSGSTFGDFGSSTCVPTVNSNRNMGTVTQYTGGLPGISFTAPRAGNYLVCFNSDVNAQTTSEEAALQLVDSNSSVISQAFRWDTSDSDATVGACASVNVPSAGSYGFRLQGAVSGGSVRIESNSTGSVNIAYFSVTELDAPMPAPYITGNVTSQSTTSGFHLEYVNFAGSTSSTTCPLSTTCTQYQTSSSWVSSIINSSGGGDYTVTFSGSPFSTTPACWVQPGGASVTINANNVSTSGLTISSRNTSGSATPIYGSLICMGPH